MSRLRFNISMSLDGYAREPLRLEGGTTFTFITGGIEVAFEHAR